MAQAGFPDSMNGKTVGNKYHVRQPYTQQSDAVGDRIKMSAQKDIPYQSLMNQHEETTVTPGSQPKPPQLATFSTIPDSERIPDPHS
ncbi:MAG: hypothetical protein AB1861_25220 [Cyanobacteriota bacterium]